jgi:hypothetical protein
VGRRHVGDGGQPDYLKYRRDGGRTSGLQERQRSDVAAQAAVIRRVVRFGLGNKSGKLSDSGHTQQEHDEECFPVAVKVSHDTDALRV